MDHRFEHHQSGKYENEQRSMTAAKLGEAAAFSPKEFEDFEERLPKKSDERYPPSEKAQLEKLIVDGEGEKRRGKIGDDQRIERKRNQRETPPSLRALVEHHARPSDLANRQVAVLYYLCEFPELHQPF
jgi:hypothetical protein